MKQKVCSTTVEPVGSRKMSFTISTANVDRDGDTIDPNGWDLTSYQRNPVVLFAHDHSQLPIGKASSLWTDHRGLHATVEFPPTGIYPFADTVHDLCKAGFLSATSVGFLSRESHPSKSGLNITKAELLEFSIVTVPSNPHALVTQRAVNKSAVQAWLGQAEESIVDWDAINGRKSEIDWDAVNGELANKAEVDWDTKEVDRVLASFVPAFRLALHAGIRLQAKEAAHAAICRMTGRLD
jgi:HK97 family phage prohead protease